MNHTSWSQGHTFTGAGEVEKLESGGYGDGIVYIQSRGVQSTQNLVSKKVCVFLPGFGDGGAGVQGQFNGIHDAAEKSGIPSFFIQGECDSEYFEKLPPISTYGKWSEDEQKQWHIAHIKSTCKKSFGNCVDELAIVLEHIKKKISDDIEVILMGHSMGGAISLATIARYEGLVDHLLLLATGVRKGPIIGEEGVKVPRIMESFPEWEKYEKAILETGDRLSSIQLFQPGNDERFDSNQFELMRKTLVTGGCKNFTHYTNISSLASSNHGMTGEGLVQYCAVHALGTIREGSANINALEAA